jgi:hypothetical protein
MKLLKVSTLATFATLALGSTAFAQGAVYNNDSPVAPKETMPMNSQDAGIDRGPTGTVIAPGGPRAVDPGMSAPGGGPIGGREEIRKERELREGATPSTIPR